MSRSPNFGPILDHLAAPVITDPAPARLRVLQAADEHAHALFSGWGGPGLWVPLHLRENVTLEFKYAVPPGVQYVALKLLVSGYGRVSFVSSVGGTPKEFEWSETGSGDTLAAAYEVSGAPELSSGPTGPLQVRSGNGFSWAITTITVVSYNTFAGGKNVDGHIWGVLLQPIHETV